MIEADGYRSLLSIPPVVAEPPAPIVLDPVLRARLLDIFGAKVFNFGSQLPIEIPGDWRVYDLQNVLTENGFSAFFSDEVAEGNAGDVYADLDFVKPDKFYEPSILVKGRFRNPAVSVDRVAENLRLVFGNLIATQSGWKLTNNDHPFTKPEGLIQPSPVTYFKFQ